MVNNVLNHHDQVVILFYVVMMDLMRIIDYQCNNAMIHQVISINMIQINGLSINLNQITLTMVKLYELIELSSVLLENILYF